MGDIVNVEKVEIEYEKAAKARAARIASIEAKRKADAEANDIIFWKLEEEYGFDSVARVNFDDGSMVVVCKPDKDEYKRMKLTIERKARKTGEDLEALAYKCVKHPVGAALDSLLAKLPGAMSPISSAVLQLAGTLQEAEGKA